jgi:hypothetical protein
MVFCSNCGQQLTGTETFCAQCGQDLRRKGRGAARPDTDESRGISIQSTHGDVLGVGISGSGNIIGKNVITGSGRIAVSEQLLQKLPHIFAQSLRKFSETLNEQIGGQQLPYDIVEEGNSILNDFAMDIENIKPGEEIDMSRVKKDILRRKLVRIVQYVIKLLPTAIQSSLFGSLEPFSMLIGESVQKVVANYIL